MITFKIIHTYVFEDRSTSIRVNGIAVRIDKDLSSKFTKMSHVANQPYTTIYYFMIPYCVTAILLQPKRFFIYQASSLDVFLRKEGIIRSRIKR